MTADFLRAIKEKDHSRLSYDAGSNQNAGTYIMYMWRSFQNSKYVDSLLELAIPLTVCWEE